MTGASATGGDRQAERSGRGQAQESPSAARRHGQGPPAARVQLTVLHRDAAGLGDRDIERGAHHRQRGPQPVALAARRLDSWRRGRLQHQRLLSRQTRPGIVSPTPSKTPSGSTAPIVTSAAVPGAVPPAACRYQGEARADVYPIGHSRRTARAAERSSARSSLKTPRT